jgi:putative nucleic acid binding protein
MNIASKLTVAIIGLLVLVLGLALILGDTRSTQTDSKGGEVTKMTDYRDYTSELQQDYARNPLTADAKYKGRLVSLTSRVMDIDRNSEGRTTVTLNMFDTTVYCVFTNNATGAYSMTKGQLDSVYGKCAGMNHGIVVLVDCRGSKDFH